MFRLRLHVEKDGNTLLLKDITGTYHSETNPGGYGGENPVMGDVGMARVNVFFNGAPYKSIDVTEAFESWDESGHLTLAEVITDKDGVYHVHYKVLMSPAFGLPGDPSGLDGTVYQTQETAYEFNSVTSWTGRFWAHLARLYDSHQYREFASNCIWLSTHIDALSSLAKLNRRREFLVLLQLVEKRILAKKQHLSALTSFWGLPI